VRGGILVGVVVLVVIFVVLGLAISMTANIPEPTARTEEATQFADLSTFMNLSYQAMWGIVLLLLAAILIGAAVLLTRGGKGMW